MDAARAVPLERRSVYLERTAAMLRLPEEMNLLTGDPTIDGF